MRNPFRRNRDAAPTPEQQLLDGATLPTHTAPLALNFIHRNLVAADDGVWAFYVLEPVDWLNQDADTRRGIMSVFTQRLTELTGMRLWIRGTSSPFPHAEWARALDEATAARRLPDPEEGRTFGDFLEGAQRYLIGTGASRYGVPVGVRFSTHKVDKPENLALVAGREPIEGRLGVLEEARRALVRVNQAMTRNGFARPISTKALGWLVHASLGLGAPAPAAYFGRRCGFDPAEVGGFTGPVVATARPYAPTTVVHAIRNSRRHTSHVAVLNVESMAARTEDTVLRAVLPWMYYPQTLDFPVETCAVFDVYDGEDLTRTAEDAQLRAQNIAAHHAEHGSVPPSIARAVARAEVVADEVASAHRDVSARVIGVVMFAVTGADEEECLDRADTLTAEVARNQKITLAHAYSQWHLYRSFTPCEPPVMSGYVTQMPVATLAAAVPHASSAAGDAVGFPLGQIAGTSEVFVLDTHAGPRKNKPGLVLVTTDLGGGKSTLLGSLMDYETTIGHQAVVFDPSWPLGRLTELPHLTRDSRLVSLAAVTPGMMVPSLLIPEPRAATYESAEEYQAAVADAKQERRELLLDAAVMLLPYRMVQADATGELVARLEDATSEVGGHYGADPWTLVDALNRQPGDTGKVIAARLVAAAERRLGAPIFPQRGRDVDDGLLNGLFDNTLTVITMRGMELPPKSAGADLSQLTEAQRASRPILHLGARLATRAIYAPGPSAVAIDEGTIITE
ncbi:MAG: hypothetical protein ACRCZD_17630, partial [Phycicoccus sp.]